MTTRAGAIMAIVGLAAAAAAQTPSFVYSFQVANPNLNPGQTTTVMVLCGFSPHIGSPVTTPTGTATVLGLSSGGFDLLGSSGSWSEISLLAPYNFIGTTPGTIGGGNVTAVLWGTGFGPHFPPTTVNPVPLWVGTFTAPATPGPVSMTIVPAGTHGVWAGNAGGFAIEVFGPATGTQAIINVIPAPTSLAPPAVGLFAATRRRRSSP